MRLGLLLLLCATTVGAGWQPRFRAGTEVVRVDVLVERDGRPVTGLTADDFIVEDAGVPQRIALLPLTGAVSVSTVLDVSGSMTADQLRNAGAAARAVASSLKYEDRHALYAFSGDAREIEMPARHAVSLDAVALALRQSGGPHTALFDALYLSILRGHRDDRPKLVVVLTDGHDNTSWLSGQAVIDAATRHDTVIYAVAIRRPSPGHPADVPPAAGDAGLRLLQILAERTGGRVVYADWSRDLGVVFEAILREYRQRYLLSFAPEGVPRGDGWHQLDVTLRDRRGRVHARKGYWSR